jgi:PAS domain S-box-containing protein
MDLPDPVPLSMQALLREREAELTRVQRIGRIGGFEIDLRDGGFRSYRSPEYLRLHGLPPDAAQEPHGAWVSRLHPQDRDRVEAGFKAAVAGTGRDYAAEYRIITPDGQRWIAAVGEIERDADGAPLLMVGVHIDITRTKLAETALNASTEQLRGVLEAIGEAYYALDADERLTTVSRRALEVWGADEAQVIGRRLGEVVSGAEAGQGYKAMQEAIRTGRSSHAEVMSVSLHGRWAEQDVYPTADGGAAIAFRDIHDRKLSEGALRASEQRFRAAVAALSGVLWTSDAAGRMTGEQSGWAALTGQTAAEYEGVGWADAVHPDDVEVTLNAWQQAVAGRGNFVIEHRVRRHDGVWRLFSVRAVPVRDADGGVREWVGVHTDITEERQVRETLRRVNETLEARVRAEVQAREATQARLQQAQRLEALGQLAGGIAHDFNNVLQAIQSGIGLISRRSDDPATVQRLAAMVREAAARGASVTRRLLAFSRRDELKPEPAALLGNLREVLTHTLGGNIEVVLDLALPLPALIGDKGQLETVLINLATNARDAMAGGGTLTIAASTQVVTRADAEPGSGLAPGTYIRLGMHDTGCGMTEETLARASEPFFTTKPVGSGTGLGLSMARGFAAQSGGTLQIESRLGHGTTVALWLPEAGVGRRSPSAETTSGTLAGIRVLLTDDDPLVREMLANELEAAGLAVLRAGEASAALALMDAGISIDVLVSDASTTHSEALTLIQAARQRQPGLPAILLTGVASDQPLPGAGDAVAVLRKPMSGMELAQRIEALLSAATPDSTDAPVRHGPGRPSDA